MKKGYTTEKNVQIIISLLKQHGIKQVIASPGSANMALVASMQCDPFFKMFSAVDERSAAYIACGMASESGEPVVITCTGATASRNYMPGMTEAYYRKLPVLAITSTQALSKVGHHIAQVIDRSVIPKDVARLSVTLPIVTNDDEVWDCEIKVNKAILELKRQGGGPAHINLPTTYDHEYVIRDIHNYRKIYRITHGCQLPALPKGRIAIIIGAHSKWTSSETKLIEEFCANHNAVVFHDHTSGYNGEYGVNYALAGSQVTFNSDHNNPELIIHLGEVSGDYYTLKISSKEVWRVNPDGEIRDTFRKLTNVFEMDESSFFNLYNEGSTSGENEYHAHCKNQLAELRTKTPSVPFSNIWIASQLADKIPDDSSMHFGILNSLRAWNFFDLPKNVTTTSNVGGFGIDGALSTSLGAALARTDHLVFCILGDLAFFYDMNTLGNRHIPNNVRILMVNNGKGTEFKQYGHVSSSFGDSLDKFVAASGHFGNQSPTLVKNYAEDLGFTYLSASNKEEFSLNTDKFLSKGPSGQPIIFEAFTNSDDECEALCEFMNIDTDAKFSAKKMIKEALKGALRKKSTKLIKQFIKS